MNTSGTISIPKDVETQVYGLATRLRNSAIAHIGTDDADLYGPFNTWTSGINFEFHKALRLGPIARHVIDCKLIDEFADWLTYRHDGQSIAEPITESDARAAISTLRRLRSKFPDQMGKAMSIIQPLLETAISCQSIPLAFLTQYRAGLAGFDKGMTAYLSELKEKANKEYDTAGDLPPDCTLVNPHSNFFDTLVAASNPADLESANGLGWEAIRQGAMQSSEARRSFWADSCKELRDEFLTEKGYSIGGWPDLPEELRKAAKGQACSLEEAAVTPEAEKVQVLRGWIH